MFHNMKIMCCSGAHLARFLTIVFLILIKNVSHIGGLASSSPFSTLLASAANTNALKKSTGETVAAVAVASMYDTHRMAKRMDLESCLGQFDVHKNTIIRTGESQAIGGKYLQGIELDTVDECQRLCCETETCDVYIFEDKNDGYCYLFECGPPENFHCKFTRHANYTSAVLTTVRHVTEVTTSRPSAAHNAGGGGAGNGGGGTNGGTTNNISQQEWELTNLKVKPETHDKMLMESVGGGIAAPSSNGGGFGDNSVAQVQPQQAEIAFPQRVSNLNAHCGRFQFTCHSGECIAVYNACDGIPQCEDGSDEGPECSGASSSSSILTSKSNTENSNINIMESAAVQQQKSAVMPSQYQSATLLQQQTPQQQLQSMQQQQRQQLLSQQLQQQQMQPSITPALVNNREDAAAWANRKIVSDTQQQIDGNGNSVDLNSRIFNHKGGLQLPTVNNGGGSMAAAATYSNPINSIYNTATLQRNAAAAAYALQQQPQSNGVFLTPQQQLMLPQGPIVLPSNWQQSPQQQQSRVTSTSPANGVQLSPGPAYIINAATPQRTQQILQTTETKSIAPAQQQQLTPAAAQVADGNIAAAPQTLKQQSKSNNKEARAKNSKDTETSEEYEDYEEKSTEPPKKIRKHKKLKTKSNSIGTAALPLPKPKDPIELALEEQKQHAPTPSPVHEQYKVIHENLVMEFRDHDGQSERPGGAMLSLSLGLLVTAALAILIGCRMRVVGRRTGRRMGGKTPYSHEADFLVNGMYL